MPALTIQVQSGYPALISLDMLGDVFEPPVSESRIRESCARAVSASDEDCEHIVTELRNAMRTHIGFLRNMTKEMRERERASTLTGTVA